MTRMFLLKGKDGSVAFWEFMPTILGEYVHMIFRDADGEIRDATTIKKARIETIMRNAKEEGIEVSEINSEKIPDAFEKTFQKNWRDLLA